MHDDIDRFRICQELGIMVITKREFRGHINMYEKCQYIYIYSMIRHNNILIMHFDHKAKLHKTYGKSGQKAQSHIYHQGQDI